MLEIEPDNIKILPVETRSDRADFVRVGTPLLIIVWLTFSLFAPWYYGI